MLPGYFVLLMAGCGTPHTYQTSGEVGRYLSPSESKRDILGIKMSRERENLDSMGEEESCYSRTLQLCR